MIENTNIIRQKIRHTPVFLGGLGGGGGARKPATGASGGCGGIEGPDKWSFCSKSIIYPFKNNGRHCKRSKGSRQSSRAGFMT